MRDLDLAFAHFGELTATDGHAPSRSGHEGPDPASGAAPRQSGAD